MHMEALDRSFSSGPHSDGVGGLSLSSYPLTPEPQLNALSQYSDHHHDCLQPEYSAIQYNDDYEYGSQLSLEPSSPIISSTTPLESHIPSSPLHNSYEDPSRTPLSGRSSYSSNSSCPQFSSSQSSGLSDMPSISNMSISSDASSSSSSSLFSEPPTLYNTSNNNYNPFCINNRTNNTVSQHQPQPQQKVSRKFGTSKPIRSIHTSNSSSSNISSEDIDSVPRRRSAPARSAAPTTANTTSNINNIRTASRKDSFVYDVQLESDNVLLFVPDLDLVKSHLMFAVREEVDVLKEKIGELMERINHLECENTVLRKYATQDTLQQLQHTAPNNP